MVLAWKNWIHRISAETFFHQNLRSKHISQTATGCYRFLCDKLRQDKFQEGKLHEKKGPKNSGPGKEPKGWSSSNVIQFALHPPHLKLDSPPHSFAKRLINSISVCRSACVCTYCWWSQKADRRLQCAVEFAAKFAGIGSKWATWWFFQQCRGSTWNFQLRSLKFLMESTMAHPRTDWPKWLFVTFAAEHKLCYTTSTKCDFGSATSFELRISSEDLF